jgi:hypothetical protein
LGGTEGPPCPSDGKIWALFEILVVFKNMVLLPAAFSYISGRFARNTQLL